MKNTKRKDMQIIPYILIFLTGVLYALFVHVATLRGWPIAKTWVFVALGVSLIILSGVFVNFVLPIQAVGLFFLAALLGAPQIIGNEWRGDVVPRQRVKEAMKDE